MPERDATPPAALLCDLDGVVWLAHEPIAGSVEAIARARSAGVRVLFVTNNSAATVRMQEEALERIGVPAVGDVVTSALAAASLVEAGERALVCGGAGLREALNDKGVDVVNGRDASDADRFDAVVVGFHRDFDYEIMRIAAAAVRRGARLVASNDDATYPTPDGPIPGGGAILAGIARAAGVEPVVAGKPHPPMAAVVAAVLGRDTSAGMSDVVMVGDRAETDGAFAVTVGCRFALVWSGVTAHGTIPEWPTPDLVEPDLAAVVERVLGVGRSPR